MQMQYLTIAERKQKRNKYIATWAFSVLMVLGGGFGVVKLAQESKVLENSKGTVPAVSAADKKLGDQQAPVVLTEYADFQCPSCKAADPILKQLLSEYQGKVVLIYRNFPLIQIHSTALLAATAAEAANLQGKFWEMHDALYQNQAIWADKSNADEIFASFAQSLGLNIEKFKSDMHSAEIQGKIKSDYDEAIRLNLDHTPTFAINGKIVANPSDYQGYKDLVEEALQ